jgi:hypothetical protein
VLGKRYKTDADRESLNGTGVRHKDNSVTALVRTVTCVQGIGGTNRAMQNKAICSRQYNENSYCLQRALKFAHKFVSYNYPNTQKLHPQ